MKQEDLEYIIANHRWRFTWLDIWHRYLTLLFPTFLLLISLGMPLAIGFVKPVIFLSVFIFPISIYFFYDISKRIKAERTFYFVTSTAISKQVVENCIAELGWTLQYSDVGSLQAQTKMSWTSWGEIITIVFLENQILINSRPDSQPFTGNRDDVNFRKLLDLIRAKEHRHLLTERL